jgi:hypothetical protein
LQTDNTRSRHRKDLRQTQKKEPSQKKEDSPPF